MSAWLLVYQRQLPDAGTSWRACARSQAEGASLASVPGRPLALASAHREHLGGVELGVEAALVSKLSTEARRAGRVGRRGSPG